MKRILFLLAMVFNVCMVSAQTKAGNSIIGTVKDAASKAPLEYATVTIFVKDSKKTLTGTTTDKAGSFTITDIPEGTYIIVFENIGYTTFTMNDVMLNKKDAIIDLKSISLAIDKKLLQGVVVTAKAKLIENKIDKMVFNAEKDVTSQSGVATDVLKKIPQVSVDVDGNVQLSGASGIKFLINGKPSAAFGSNIADVLQSIPASQIKSVEVITNPGAKYDAQGLGGIINIILKTSNTKGYNGNISLTAGTRIENAALNLTVRNNNFGVNAFFSGNERLPSDIVVNNNRTTTAANVTSTLQQVATARFKRHGFQTGAGFDWTYKKKNSLSGNISFNQFGSDGKGNTSQTLQTDINSGLPAILSLTNAADKGTFNSIDASLNYKRKFAKEDQALEFSISRSHGSNSGTSFSDVYTLPQDTLTYGTRSSSPSKNNETELTVDYTQPLQHDVNFGFGGKASFYNYNSNADVTSYQAATKNYLPNAFLSTELDYKQKVYAAYAEMSFPVGKLFNAKIGGRYERTEIDAIYSNAQQQVNIPGYNTFVPSVFLSKKLGEKQTIKLSYSKRINRPDFDDLNPFVNTTDPKNLSTGNPYLNPEIGHRFEFGYSRDLGKLGSLMMNLFYRINEHDIQGYVVYYPTYKVGDSTYTNVSVNKRQNIGQENNMGMNLFGDFHFTPKLNIRSNVFMFFRHTINQIDAGYSKNSFNYRFNMNASYQFTNTLLAEFFGNFNGPRHEAQGRYPSFTSYSFAVRKQFWNKKGSLALTANNFLSAEVHQKTVLFGPNFTTNGERIIPFRSVGINFSWKFGKLEFKKDENRENMGEGAN